MTNKELVKIALDNAKKIKEIRDGKETSYFELMLNQRLKGPNNAGSYYDVESIEELYKMLIEQEWEEVQDDNVSAGKILLKSKLPGIQNIQSIDDMDDNSEIYTINTKNTECVEAGCHDITGTPANETYMIISKETDIDGEKCPLALTFFPGALIKASEVPAKDYPHGTKLTKEQAKQLGYTHVKYISEEIRDNCRKIQDENKKDIIDDDDDGR